MSSFPSQARPTQSPFRAALPKRDTDRAAWGAARARKLSRNLPNPSGSGGTACHLLTPGLDPSWFWTLGPRGPCPLLGCGPQMTTRFLTGLLAE